MNRKAFTLVELIVVVTVLAILATIGFVAYSSYLLGARDSNRIASLAGIANGLKLYQSQKKVPLPDDNIDIKSDGIIIGRQGYAGANVLETIGYTKGGKDPLDAQYYSFYLTNNRKNFQLLAFLETKENLEIDDVEASVFSQAKAEDIDYYGRYPKLYGKGLGIMTDENKTPLQEIPLLVEQGYLDILTTSDNYIAYIDDENKLTGDNTILHTLSPYASCSRLRDVLGKQVSGFYNINPTGVSGQDYRVYCEMELGGGGWTLIATSAEDGNHTWTYDNRVLLSSTGTIGDVNNYKQDFKSKAYSEILFKDVMFLDKQGVWGAYDDIQPNRLQTMDQFMPMTPVCAYQGTGEPYYMTSGSISKNRGTNDEQHDRTLFFTVRDHESGCTTSDDSNDQHAIGPTWGYTQNDGDSPDDPGLMGWGPSQTISSSYRWNRPDEECRDARVGRKGGDNDEICEGTDGDYILWFVR